MIKTITAIGSAGPFLGFSKIQNMQNLQVNPIHFFDSASCARCLIFNLSKFALGQLTVSASSPFFS
jgi:hypothetical protein